MLLLAERTDLPREDLRFEPRSPLILILQADLEGFFPVGDLKPPAPCFTGLPFRFLGGFDLLGEKFGAAMMAKVLLRLTDRIAFGFVMNQLAAFSGHASPALS